MCFIFLHAKHFYNRWWFKHFYFTLNYLGGVRRENGVEKIVATVTQRSSPCGASEPAGYCLLPTEASWSWAELSKTAGMRRDIPEELQQERCRGKRAWVKGNRRKGKEFGKRLTDGCFFCYHGKYSLNGKQDGRVWDTCQGPESLLGEQPHVLHGNMTERLYYLE